MRMAVRFRMAVALAAFALAMLAGTGLVLVARRTRLFSEHPVRRLMHRTILALVGIRVHVRGQPAGRRPLLIASNHVSWTDIMVIGAHADVFFVARGDVARWPFIGMVARAQRTLFVDRESRRSAGRQTGEIAQRLAAGDAVVLFAEGTTGDGSGVLPFKSSLFAAALGTGAGEPAGTMSVQPVALAYVRRHGVPMGRSERADCAWIGDQDLMPHLATLLAGGPIDAELAFGEPLAIDGATTRKELARVVEARVAGLLAEILHRPAD